MRASPAITDEAVEASPAHRHPRAPRLPITSDPGTGAFRNVAIAHGDDNPLWCDPVRRETRWEEAIAPPGCWPAATR